MKTTTTHSQKLIALKKTKSLIETMINMVETDRYCIDIMQQNMAAIGLLKNLHKNLMENHLNCCFKEAMASTDKTKQQQMIEEIMTVTHLANK